MSYEPTTWKDGDLVTSAKLNKLEQGVASAGESGSGGILVVHVDENDVLDRTWQEIHDADLCVLKYMDETGVDWNPIRNAYYNENENIYTVYGPYMDHTLYITDNPNGYPAYNAEEGQGPK